MGRLDQYVAIELAKAYGLVLLVLLALFSIFTFAEQLEDVGDGAYELGNAIQYVLLTIPDRVLALAPFVMLLGGLFALGALARNRELIAIQAAGVSRYPVQTAC